MNDDNETSSPPEKPYKTGKVAFVGRPNAGKSTLMNQILPEKLAIVSSKPQTTRQRIVGILSEDQGQMIFYDTPGVHKPEHAMNRRMLKAAQEALNEADVVCLVVDFTQKHGSGDAFMLDWLGQVESKKIAVLNKIDRVREKREILPRIALYADTGAFEEIIPASAKTGDGVDLIEAALWQLLPEGEPYYAPDLLTIHPERFLVAERIREKVLERTREELPFSTAVVIDGYEESPGQTTVYASILVEREGQKKILIGKGGSKIKDVGTAARLDLEAYLETKVYLDLKVRLEKNWRENRRILTDLDRAPFDVTLPVEPPDPFEDLDDE